MILSPSLLLRLQTLAKKAIDEGSTEEERNTSGRILASELKKIGFFEAMSMGLFNREELSSRPVVVDTRPEPPKAGSRRHYHRHPDVVPISPNSPRDFRRVEPQRPEFGKKRGRG
jgi:hypothetical protein